VMHFGAATAGASSTKPEVQIMIRTVLPAAAASLLFSSAAMTATQAAPIAPIASTQVTSDVILVEGGCGPGVFRDRYGRCQVAGAPVVVAPGGPVVVAPVVVAPPVVCERGFRWHPRFRRCVVL
jgi:hypothetical protein